MTSPLGSFLEGAFGGVQQGYQFRTGIEDRKRRIATEDETAQYEQARRLREGVAFELQQRVANAQLENIAADNERADRAAALTTYQTMFPKPDKPLVQDWQKEGFKTQADWQTYHKQISRAGASGERGQVTPRDRFSERTRLMAPHWGVNQATGQMEMQPGVSAAEADRIVREAESGPTPYSPQPRVTPRGHGRAGPGATRPGAAPRPVGPSLEALGALADEIIQQHPDWDDAQVSDEVRRRAGIR